MTKAISIKGWLVFGEARTDGMKPAVEWKKPHPEFLKAWNTTAIPVLVRNVASHKMDVRIEYSERDGGWVQVEGGDR